MINILLGYLMIKNVPLLFMWQDADFVLSLIEDKVLFWFDQINDLINALQ